MTTNISRPRVFLDVSHGTEPLGRLVIELFIDKAPKTCENFRTICTGQDPASLSYKGSPFHRVIDEFMVQGGDITRGDGTGGESIYGGEFEDENIGWREIDKEGLVCMANRGKDTNSSQFFITLAPTPHLNAKHTVFGHLVAGQGTLSRMAKAPVDNSDKPLEPVLISNCGELERRKKQQHDSKLNSSTTATARLSAPSSISRGRRKRRHTSSSRSRSPSPSRGHTRRSASRHRHRHRRRRETRSDSRSDSGRRSSSSPLPPPRAKNRRRSDASPDHTLRGRPRQRSRSRTDTPILEGVEEEERRHRRQRSSPPSREGSERDMRASQSPGFRRQRSLPNQYDQWHAGRRRMDERVREQDRDRDRGEWRGGRYSGRDDAHGRFEDRMDTSEGRLGGGGAWDDHFADAAGADGIVYKGRGAMKYREEQQRRRRW